MPVGLRSELIREGRLHPLDQPLDFTSYPYEWGFLQLKDAALLTLDVAARALRRGFTLQHASAFQVQFIGTAPVLLDSLLFAPAQPGPWPAYEPFCRHFLAPLLLMAHVSPTANQLLHFHPDGIPLDHASRSLPFRTWLKPGAFLHLHAHARAADRFRPPLARRLPQAALIESLRRTISSLQPLQQHSVWSDYRAQAPRLSPAGVHFKECQVQFAAEAIRGGLVYDMGANTGQFARIAALTGAHCVAFDPDPLCVDACYRIDRSAGRRNILPLLLDTGDPGVALDSDLPNRLGLLHRPKAALVLVLAAAQYLRISANIPFLHIASLFRHLSSNLLIEFVEPNDPTLSRFLQSTGQVLPEDYSLDNFTHAFTRYFRLRSRLPVPGANRWLCRFSTEAA